jgi:hypothetical protein
MEMGGHQIKPAHLVEECLTQRVVAFDRNIFSGVRLPGDDSGVDRVVRQLCWQPASSIQIKITPLLNYLGPQLP